MVFFICAFFFRRENQVIKPGTVRISVEVLHVVDGG